MTEAPRREQGSANLDLRRDRGVVSALAFDRGRQTELSEHLVPLSKRFQPNDSRTSSSDRHGWIRILRESRQTSVWVSVSLWSGDQDPPKRLHREGGAQSGAWGWVEIGTGAARLGGLSETQHVVCRTIESHDPTGLGISWPPDDLSCSMEETT
jgi:hypothetical protein